MTDSIVLVSADNVEFQISKETAFVSSTLRAMLVSPFLESNGKIAFPEIESKVLEKVIEYLEYNLQYRDAEENAEIPEFEIPTEMSLELLLAADYLGV